MSQGFSSSTPAVEPGIEGPAPGIGYPPGEAGLPLLMGFGIAMPGIPPGLGIAPGIAPGMPAGRGELGIPGIPGPGIPGIPGEPEAPAAPPKLTVWTWSGRSRTRVTSTGMLELAHWANSFGSRR